MQKIRSLFIFDYYMVCKNFRPGKEGMDFLLSGADNMAQNMADILGIARPAVELLSLICHETPMDRTRRRRIHLLQRPFPLLTHLTVKGPDELPCAPNFAPLLCALDVGDDILSSAKFATHLARHHPLLLRLRISQYRIGAERAPVIFLLLHAMRIDVPSKLIITPPPVQLAAGMRRTVNLEAGAASASSKDRDKRIVEIIAK
ncbi:hypothetical protein C8R43DRAFT_1243594 [Mycena crocata]|nr:hypothetical protein C8R43DRAFT_1243594 [Mycena crocata]